MSLVEAVSYYIREWNSCWECLLFSSLKSSMNGVNNWSFDSKFITNLSWGNIAFFLPKHDIFRTDKKSDDDLSEKVFTKIRRDYSVHKMNRMLLADLREDGIWQYEIPI